MSSRLRVFTVLLPLALAACAGRDEPALGTIALPTQWGAPVTQNTAAWPDARWWTGFKSDELDALITRAKANNLDLAAAAARILQSQGQSKSTSAALLPSLDLGSSLSNRDSFTNDAAATSANPNSFDLSASANYELDFWGRNRADARAARRALDASQFDRETVALTVTANVASSYFQILSLRERLAIARANLANIEDVLKLVEAKANAGVATPLELAQQRSAYARQQAAIPPLEQQEREAAATLALLLGVPAQGFTVSAQNLDGVALPAIAPGLPSELMTRRPDIAKAEADLEGADASVASARAAFYPSISLTGSAGFSSGAIAALINPAAAAYSAGASLAQPLFDGRRLSGQLETAKGRQKEVLSSYRSTVITAFTEVANTLGSNDALTRQQTFQNEDVVQSQRAYDIAQARYRAGVEEFLTVLDTQRTLFSARDSQAQTKLSRLQALVTLYRVLGGGWSAPQK